MFGFVNLSIYGHNASQECSDHSLFIGLHSRNDA